MEGNSMERPRRKRLQTLLVSDDAVEELRRGRSACSSVQEIGRHWTAKVMEAASTPRDLLMS